MTKLSSKVIRSLVLLSTVSLSLLGCTGPLEQQTRTIKLAPVSEQYKLAKQLEGRAYVLLAQTSTGQEQHRYAVSDSLTRALEENAIPPHGDGGVNRLTLPSHGRVQVLSFSDLANQLNENGISQRLAEMRQFYQENGMFKKSDLEFLAKEIRADYLILPCLIDIRRWGAGRLSMFGLKIINTQVVSGVVSMEIWDVRSGRKVFGATADVTIANERISEEPIAIEEAFERAWVGIIGELPKSNPPPRLASQGAGAGDHDRLMAAAVSTRQDNAFSKKAENNLLAK